MKILKKLGKLRNIYDILTKSGLNIKYQTLAQQVWRKRLSKEVVIALWDYCLKNNIPVSVSDFKEA